MRPRLCLACRWDGSPVPTANGTSASMPGSTVPARTFSSTRATSGVSDRSGADQAAFAGQLEHRLLKFLEGADLDLADAFAADVLDLAQILARLGVVGQAAFGQNMALALVQRFERLVEQVVAHATFHRLGGAPVLPRFPIAGP